MSTSITLALTRSPAADTAIGALGLALVVASVTDLARRRIPNWITFSAAVAGFVIHGMAGGRWLLASSLAGFFLWFFAGFAFWTLSRGQGIGAGDVKMAMASGALLGAWPTLYVVFLSNLAQVVYLFLRWLVTGTLWANAKLLFAWLISLLAPNTKVVHFKPVGMEDKTPHAPFMLIGALVTVYLSRKGVLPW